MRSDQTQVTVLLTSLNSAKGDATEAIFRLALGHQAVVIRIEAISGVSATPVGDKEAIQGCRNRVESVRHNHPDVDFIVGLEGAMEHQPHGVFVYGWALVEHRQSGRQGIGCSARVMLPPAIAGRIGRQESLSERAARHYGLASAAAMAAIGTNGVVTNGLFSRRDEFEGALRCALGFVVNDKNFD